MTPIYAGLMGSWVYESVWVWQNGRWTLVRSSGPEYRYLSPLDPCGAFSPVGLEPNFYWMTPPYRSYQVHRYNSLMQRWDLCASAMNWK